MTLGKAKKKKKYRKKFSGERTDTEIVKRVLVTNGCIYNVRKDGSRYPAPTTISVSKPVLDIYATLREKWKCNNYDELLMKIINILMKEKHLTPFIIETLEGRIKVANTHIKMRERTRSKAKDRHRYSHRKTGLIDTKPIS